MRKNSQNRSLTTIVVVAIFVTAFSGVALSFGDLKRTAVITASEIQAHIKFLASDELAGRLAGTEGAEKAAQYIASEFRSYGLKPVGDDGTFMQSFSFVGGVKAGPRNMLKWNVRGSVKEFKAGEDFSPLAFSRDEPVEAEVVFAGYGISASELNYDDYAGVDVKGKIVLVLKNTPEGDDPRSKFQKYSSLRYKALTAREKGAKGIILTASEEKLKDDRLAALRYDQSFGDSGIAAVVVSRQVADAMLQEAGKSLSEVQKTLDSTKTANSFPLLPSRLTCRTDVIKEMKTTGNVVALLEGSDPKLKSEMIVIGAHYDHIGLGSEASLSPDETGKVHNGADDNASGVAGLLELAQALSSARDQLKRSLLFISFSGEEEGLLGSSYYVKSPIHPLNQTVAMINLDMVGRLKGDSLIVYGTGTSPVWKPTLDRLNENTKFALKSVEDGVGPSDQTSFYLKDIPVLHFFTGAHEDHHKPSDDYDKINAEGEQRILEFICQLVRGIDGQQERPLFTKTKGSEEQRPQAGLRVYIGTIPDLAEPVEGLKLAGVRDGSPAQRAGLQAGDVVVRVGNRDVRNVYDYTYALQDLTPGEEVEFIALRNATRLSFKVMPERRN